MLCWRGLKKLLSQIISIYGCNASPPAGKMSFFITHWQSLNNRWRLYGWCCGWRQETLCIWGANSSWLCSFSFLILKSQSQLRCQGTTAQRGESCHCTASQPPGTPALLSPRDKAPSGLKSHIFHTPTNSPHSSSISSLANNKAAKSRGRLVFTTAYQRCDARLLKLFVRSDVLCLPTEDYETTLNPRASSLTRPSLPGPARDSSTLPPALPNCFSRSPKTSATGLSAPYSLRKQRKIQREQALDGRFGVKSLVLASHAGKMKADPACSKLCSLTGAQPGWLLQAPGQRKHRECSWNSLTSAAERVPGREADLPNNPNWKITTVCIAWQGRGAHRLLSWAAHQCPSSNFAPASRNLFWWFEQAALTFKALEGF